MYYWIVVDTTHGIEYIQSNILQKDDTVQIDDIPFNFSQVFHENLICSYDLLDMV